MQAFKMDVNNFQKAEVEDNFAPIPKGSYQVDIAEAAFDYGQTKTGKHIGANRTLLKLKLDVYNAKQDGGSRPMWTNLMLEHDAANNDSGMMNMVKKNNNNLFDLVTQVIRTGYQGNVQASPFAQGLTADNADYLVGQTIAVDIYVNKAKENEIGSYFPQEAVAPVQNQNVQQNNQNNQNNQVQNNQNNNQNQNVQQNNQNQNVQNNQQNQNNNQNQNYQQMPSNNQQGQSDMGKSQTVQQNQNSTTGTTATSPSNQGNNQGGLPPFAMQQNQG
tara:strand:+ start:191107 stop:191928 length:822 start_codon:yes stop_codon:yes gene_type:complete